MYKKQELGIENQNVYCNSELHSMHHQIQG
jgi:hypothetical protein